MKKQSMKNGILAMFSSFFLVAGTVLYLNYVTVCYNTLGGVDTTISGTAMALVSLAGFFLAAIIGAWIQKTKTRRGQYRPWILGSAIVSVLAGFLMLFNFSSPLVNCIVITIGYLLVSCAADASFVVQYGAYEKLSQGDSGARATISGLAMAGSNAGYILYGVAFPFLLGVFGGETAGSASYAGAHGVMAALAVAGALILYFITKPFDRDNRNSTEEGTVESTSLIDLLKSVVQNRILLAVALADLFRWASYFAFTYVLVYQCMFVLGDFDMTVYGLGMTLCSIGGVVGSMLAPWFQKILGGRKKTCIIMSIPYFLGFIIFGFVSNSVPGMLICFALVTIPQTIVHDSDTLLYMDAGEVWYNKTGNDTRAFTMSANSLVSKISMMIASFAYGIILTASGWTVDALELTAEGCTTLSRLTGFVPAIGVAAYAIVLLLMHNVSDKEMVRCIEENAVKDAELYGESM